MDVTREPVSRVITRIAIGGGQLQSVKRLQ
jgi:hypothetical protein